MRVSRSAHNVFHFSIDNWRASEASETLTIRGNSISIRITLEIELFTVLNSFAGAVKT